jgi:tetratricopeptide (TPR) repeat protein
MMQLELRSPAKKSAALVALFSFMAAYVALSAAQFLAALFSNIPDPVWLKRAVWLDPGNAEHRYRLGRYELLAGQSPQTSLPWLRSAAALNPHAGRYWADLALAQQSLGDINSEKGSLENALAADPHTPEIAWDAANLYLAQGLTDDAMRKFHTVLQSDPELTWPAIRTCWRIRPDIDYLLDNVIPPVVYPAMLEFLIANSETAAAEKIWAQMFSTQQPMERQGIFGYVRYLILHREVAQAARVWQESAGMASLQAYEPSSANLLVNGDFGLDMLNGGFDWVHQKIDGVSLALDPNEAHSSSRSLRIAFDGPGIRDAGISQVVTVEPNTSYEFSAFYKAEDMEGAGGMQFAIQDAYKETSFLMSEDLRDADFWKMTSGIFTTGPDTELVIVRIVRVPPDSPIRGKLWIDGLQLVPSGNVASPVAKADQ